MHNQDIRDKAQQSGVKLWEIAQEIGINDGNFSRKLRRELPDQEKAEIFAIIEHISSER